MIGKVRKYRCGCNVINKMCRCTVCGLCPVNLCYILTGEGYINIMCNVYVVVFWGFFAFILLVCELVSFCMSGF